MVTIGKTPTFNLKAVIQETGIKPDTLRAWERRYGLPHPKRTPGGHRLYSQRDIDTLKWLAARQEEGFSISRAVALWRQLEEEGRDPLFDPAYALPASSPVPSFIPEGGAITELREAWLSACLDFDEPKAEQVLTYALALYPAETVCFEILQKGLSEVGERWYRGELNVQQEHFTSELAMRRLEALVAVMPAPTRAGRVLIGCAPDEQHTFPALLLAFLLKRRGWEVVYLGARVPASRLEETSTTVNPHLVILTAQHLSTAAALLDVAQALQDEQVMLAFGGRIFNLLPELRHRIPGHFLGERLETASQVVEQILISSAPLPHTEPASSAYQAALAHFHQRRVQIEGQMWQRAEAMGLAADHLSIANEMLASNITAALRLGDMDFLRPDIQWIGDLLYNLQLPDELLHHYLQTYLQLALTVLDERGDPITAWLARLNGHSAERED